ncbi:MAG: hypothetical protein Q8K72_03210, partial [Acidimicrobiales bacterium]|nr:hypothetical protein [Acidimicrobiales bacterium]
MFDSCSKHPHEQGAAVCRRCGDSWCSTCLVYAFGPKKPPYCMGCAMVAGGVRSVATRPALPRREVKARQKALKAQAKAEAIAARTVGGPAADAEPVGDLKETDWSTPWWE